MRRQKIIKKFFTFGIIHITVTLNNIIVSLSDKFGNTLYWQSGGTVGYTGSKKNTSLAGKTVLKNVALEAIKYKIKILTIIIKGTGKKGKGHENLIEIFDQFNFSIRSIQERIVIPHNGCRPPKKRKL